MLGAHGAPRSGGLRMGAEVFQTSKACCSSRASPTSLGDEAAFAPRSESNDAPVRSGGGDRAGWL